MTSANAFHLFSDLVFVCVGIEFREASYVHLHTGHDVAYEGPSASLLVPAQSIQVLDVKSCGIGRWVLIKGVSNRFALCWVYFCHEFQCLEYIAV